MIIYKVTNLINKKIYIGETIKNLEYRKNRHIRDAFNYNSQLVFHKALRKYKLNNFLWEIIDTASTQDELNEKEIYWIKFYNSFGINGYNSTLGGEGTSGYKLSEEAKKKASERFKGSKHPKAKLTEEDVLEIKEFIKKGISLTNIAKKFKVNRETISCIKSGALWSHVGEDVSYIECSKTSQAKLTNEDVKEIKSLLKDKEMTYEEIADLYGVNKVTISSIKRGKTWRNVGDETADIEYSNKGINNGQSKLKDDDVKNIKILLKEGRLLQREIAEIFGVGVTTISQIKLGNRWTHVVV